MGVTRIPSGTAIGCDVAVRIPVFSVEGEEYLR